MGEGEEKDGSVTCPNMSDTKHLNELKQEQGHFYQQEKHKLFCTGHEDSLHSQVTWGQGENCCLEVPCWVSDGQGSNTAPGVNFQSPPPRTGLLQVVSGDDGC